MWPRYKNTFVALLLLESSWKRIPAVFPRTGLITVYLLVFHRHHGANARVQSSAADDKQSCLFAPISSVRQFCCRSKPNVITGPAGRTATPKTIGVKELRFFSQIMQVRWPNVLSRSIRPLARFFSAPPLTLSSSLAPTYLTRFDSVSLPENSPCFCRPIVSARVAASSAQPLCEFINVFIHSAGIVSQLLSYSPRLSLSLAQRLSLPANVSFHRY